MPNKYWKNRYQRNPKDQKNRSYKHLYDITLDDYNRMYANQNGCCMICDRPFDVLCVDHNHETNNIRGLLCSSCNRSLGFVDKHKDKIIKYLLG